MQTLTGRETVSTLSEPTQSNGTKATDSTPATVDAIHAAISEAAYFIAQRRGFQPGHEVDDWLEAEAQVMDRVGAIID
jgi:hypothetical protein